LVQNEHTIHQLSIITRKTYFSVFVKIVSNNIVVIGVCRTVVLDARTPTNKQTVTRSRDIIELTWPPPLFLPVERVTDFDNNKDRQRHRLGMWIVEDLTVEAREHSRLSRTLHVVGLTDRSNNVTYTRIQHMLQRLGVNH